MNTVQIVVANLVAQFLEQHPHLVKHYEICYECGEPVDIDVAITPHEPDCPGIPCECSLHYHEECYRECGICEKLIDHDEDTCIVGGEIFHERCLESLDNLREIA